MQVPPLRRLLPATLLAAAAVTSPATAAAPEGARDGSPRARAAQDGFPTMPVVEDPAYITSGQPTPDAAASTVGSDAATVDPGTTTGTSGVERVRVRCSTRRRARRVRCVARSGDEVVARCAYRARRRLPRHARSCRRRAERLLATDARARAASIDWQGWPSQVAPAVGKLYYQGRALCSATVVDPTLVLTAAHCIWSNGGYIDWRQIQFVPGHTWGNADDETSIQTPYGSWGLSNMWVPEAYARGDFSADYALLEIPPLTDGRRISQLVGAYTITPNIQWVASTRSYLMGYPVFGFWSTRDGLHGRGQYACDSSWSNRYTRDGAGWSVYTDCSMNQGASGGPWFLLVNGGWTIGGVNSRCTAYPGSPPGVCSPYAREMITSYFDNAFLDFWNAVQPQLSYR